MSKVIVIGGGASGMMAAIRAAEKGHMVILLEKNEKLGKKLYITGKGRCNITNACDTEELFHNVLRNPKFLYSAFYTFSNWQVIDFFEKHGLKTKVERGERVFPVSDRSSDVTAVLRKALVKQKVDIRLSVRVREILADKGQITGVRLGDGTILNADSIVLATGGCSYPATGSTGDGYLFAAHMGHTVTKRVPSLTAFEGEEGWIKELQGLSLKNVSVTIQKDAKILYEAFGEMLFTHYGVSGPLLLSASSVVNDYGNKMPLKMTINLKPALDEQQLDNRVLRDFEENRNRSFKNAVQRLFPTKLIPIIVALSDVPAEKKVNEITREERSTFIALIRNFPVTLTRLRSFDEAIITRGGISVQEVNPSTMESKKIQGLYFAGEVLDVDALTGGFNLQVAWSTGFLAGDSIKEETYGF